jgi:hypothetical protein
MSALVRIYAESNIHKSWFIQNNSTNSFKLRFNKPASNYERLSPLLKPACIDYRYANTMLISAVAYALVEECKQQNEIYHNDFCWKKFCVDRNLNFKTKPSRENLVDIEWWENYLHRALDFAENITKFLTSNSSFKILPNSIYKEQEKNRERHFQIIGNVINDPKYNKRRCETTQNDARLDGICDLALEYEENNIYHVTIRLPNEYHRSSARAWKHYDPHTTSERLHKLIKSLRNPLRKQADIDSVEAYFSYTIEPHQDGTPHLHMLVAYHDLLHLQKVIEQRYKAIFRYLSEDSIKVIDHTDSPRIAINYILKHYWSTQYEISREEAWRQAFNIRSFGILSLNRKLPPLSLWNQARKGPDAECNQGLSVRLCNAAQAHDYAEFCREYDLSKSTPPKVPVIAKALPLPKVPVTAKALPLPKVPVTAKALPLPKVPVTAKALPLPRVPVTTKALPLPKVPVTTKAFVSLKALTPDHGLLKRVYHKLKFFRDNIQTTINYIETNCVIKNFTSIIKRVLKIVDN